MQIVVLRNGVLLKQISKNVKVALGLGDEERLKEF